MDRHRLEQIRSAAARRRARSLAGRIDDLADALSSAAADAMLYHEACFDGDNDRSMSQNIGRQDFTHAITRWNAAHSTKFTGSIRAGATAS